MKENNKLVTSNQGGHVDILLATLFAVIGIVILGWGAANDNNTAIWIGAIAAAICLFAQFAFVHNELTRLWATVDELSKK